MQSVYYCFVPFLHTFYATAIAAVVTVDQSKFNVQINKQNYYNNTHFDYLHNLFSIYWMKLAANKNDDLRVAHDIEIIISPVEIWLFSLTPSKIVFF